MCFVIADEHGSFWKDQFTGNANPGLSLVTGLYKGGHKIRPDILERKKVLTDGSETIFTA